MTGRFTPSELGSLFFSFFTSRAQLPSSLSLVVWYSCPGCRNCFTNGRCYCRCQLVSGTAHYSNYPNIPDQTHAHHHLLRHTVNSSEFCLPPYGLLLFSLQLSNHIAFSYYTIEPPLNRHRSPRAPCERRPNKNPHYFFARLPFSLPPDTGTSKQLYRALGWTVNHHLLHRRTARTLELQAAAAVCPQGTMTSS